MTTDALAELHQTRPFRTFSIRLGDGQSLEVRHPEMLSYSPKSRVAVVFRPDGGFQIVDLLLITGLEVNPPRNGRGSKPKRASG
jgi:hypothetical protein